jgi:hypothetical protein
VSGHLFDSNRGGPAGANARDSCTSSSCEPSPPAPPALLYMTIVRPTTACHLSHFLHPITTLAGNPRCSVYIAVSRFSVSKPKTITQSPRNTTKTNLYYLPPPLAAPPHYNTTHHVHHLAPSRSSEHPHSHYRSNNNIIILRTPSILHPPLR